MKNRAPTKVTKANQSGLADLPPDDPPLPSCETSGQPASAKSDTKSIAAQSFLNMASPSAENLSNMPFYMPQNLVQQLRCHELANKTSLKPENSNPGAVVSVAN
jgi:hypothetical protein